MVTKYRTEWTITPDVSRGHGVHWFRGDYEGDQMNTCDTIEEAEREIDDAIIAEQEQIIDKLRDALMHSTACLVAADSTLKLLNVDTVIPQQIEKNKQVLKNTES